MSTQSFLPSPSPSSSSQHEHPGHTAERDVHVLRRELTGLMLTEKRSLLRVAASILHNDAEAEDVLHTAFCAAWRSIASFRGEAALKTWFTRIVANCALVALRRTRSHTVISIEDNPESLQRYEMTFCGAIEDPEKLAIQHEQMQLLNGLIEGLPQETRLLFMLYLSGDRTIEEIAELRGKSRPAVRDQLYRGRAMLRKSLHRATRQQKLRSRAPASHR